MQGDYLVDDFVSVTPGEPYRLFPFGQIVKNGKKRQLTPELAAKFRLPHFKPPIKRGSHAEDAPAGGHIKALEVRSDGLWAIPELNENGVKDITEGAYRYHSPEVIWEDGPVFEDPQTGEFINGPLIVGDALLHMPHLGEAAALYTVEPITKGVENMTEQTRWEKFQAWFEEKFEQPEPLKTEPTPQVDVAEYEALTAQAAAAEQYKAELDQLKAQAAQTARLEKFSAALAETKANGELAELLAALEDAQAERLVQEFKALSAQIDESALLAEKGTAGDGLPDDPAQAINAAVLAKQAELKSDYVTAFNAVRAASPELFQNYGG